MDGPFPFNNEVMDHLYDELAEPYGCEVVKGLLDKNFMKNWAKDCKTQISFPNTWLEVSFRLYVQTNLCGLSDEIAFMQELAFLRNVNVIEMIELTFRKGITIVFSFQDLGSNVCNFFIIK